jgi:hypothetical protein
MKKNLLVLGLCLIFILAVSCSHKVYKAPDFEERTFDHKLVAVLPAEMIFTGKQQKNLTADDIARIEEQESEDFQRALYNSILRHANDGRYETTVNFQDINTTMRLLEEKNISARESWKMSNDELEKVLGVDAVVKMRIQKQRYMSDQASYGISVAKSVIYRAGVGSRIPVPNVPEKTNDIYASCNLVKAGQTLWHDNYKYASDYNNPVNEVIEGIADNFGEHFPYKRKRK